MCTKLEDNNVPYIISINVMFKFGKKLENNSHINIFYYRGSGKYSGEYKKEKGWHDKDGEYTIDYGYYNCSDKELKKLINYYENYGLCYSFTFNKEEYSEYYNEVKRKINSNKMFIPISSSGSIVYKVVDLKQKK